MNLMNNMLARFAVLASVALAPACTNAQNLLTDGDLSDWTTDIFQDLPDHWQLVSNPTPPTRFPALGQDFADHTTRHQVDAANRGLWYLPFEGNYPGYPDVELVDADLSQVVPATPGVKYGLAGWALFENGYAGGVDTIDPASPSPRAGMPSLTDTYFALEFLDHLDLEISSVELELKAAGQVNGAGWKRHILTGIAPLGTAKVRVRASMVDGEFNIDNPNQSAFVDDFVLQVVPEPTTGLLGVFGLSCLVTVRRRS
jgi:hypothetical protein